MVKATDLNLSSQVSVSFVSAGSNPAGVVVIDQYFFCLFGSWSMLDGLCTKQLTFWIYVVGKEGGGRGEP